MGSSGSGKSTLLRCINKLERQTSGKILYHDKEVRNVQKDINEYRSRVGMVFQSFNLFPQYTALRNCTLARELMAKERPDFKENKKQILAEIQAEGEALLESVGLKEKMDFYPHQLSGGMQQRVIIAIALALITKEVYSSLFIGILVGGLLYSNFAFELSLIHI